MFKLVIALLCALIVAIFAVQNYQTVPIRFLTVSLDISLALIIIGSAAVGAIFAFVLGIFRQFSQGRIIKGYKQRVTKMEKELQKLQGEKPALPLEEGEEGELVGANQERVDGTSSAALRGLEVSRWQNFAPVAIYG